MRDMDKGDFTVDGCKVNLTRSQLEMICEACDPTMYDNVTSEDIRQMLIEYGVENGDLVVDDNGEAFPADYAHELETDARMLTHEMELIQGQYYR